MNEPIIVYGTRRSGLHCICFDIIQTAKLNHKETIEFVNDTDYKTYSTSTVSNKMFLFEDKFYTNIDELKNKKTIIIIRDVYDNIISRSKVYQASKAGWWGEINHNYINVYINILKEILGHTNHYPNKIIINYDLYIDEITEYRKQTLHNQFNYQEIERMSENVPSYGGGRSFKKNESRKDVRITQDTIARLNNNIFLNLIQEYFHYDLLDKLKEHIS